MKTTALFICAVLIGSSAAVANELASDSAAPAYDENWITEPGRTDVLLIETTETAIGSILGDLGVAHDLYTGDDFSTIDLSPYVHVIVAMDGGAIEEGSIANVAAFASGGGLLHFIGGTAWQPFAVAVNSHLVANEIDDYYWMISTIPHVTLTDPDHCLSVGLPGSYNFTDPSAAYYMIRVTDGAIDQAAENGDGYPLLFSKSVGSGWFDWCINSPYSLYWVDAGDYGWLLQVVTNMLQEMPSPVGETTWGRIKGLYR